MSRFPSEWCSTRRHGNFLTLNGEPAWRLTTIHLRRAGAAARQKRRRYLVELVEGGEFHSHAGFVPHADIVEAVEGTVQWSTHGAEYTVLRPTLEDFVLEMPRGAQVIYPKDLPRYVCWPTFFPA